MGRRQRRDLGGALRGAAREGRPRTSAPATTSTSSTRSPAPTRRIGSPSASSPSYPYHALFAKTMFIDPTEEELRDVRAAGARPARARARGRSRRSTARAAARSSSCIRRAQEVLIGGTFYAGEIKKSIFTLMNDRLPLEGVFPMHCSANVGDDGDVAIFFGLSGTGKTTLSADPERALIGDDEHGWGDDGVFNFEGGCYAKVIRLSAEAEPEIFKTTRTFGTILENVVLDERGVLDLDDDSKTENTRAAYKLEQIANALPAKRAGHPSSVDHPHRRRVRDPAADRAPHPRPGDVLLPLRLHREARRHRDRRHGAAADVLDVLRRAVPAAAAGRLRAAARRRSSTSTAPQVWLVNTGWTGGPFGEGARMPIEATRALLRAALAGELAGVEYRTDPSLRLRGAGRRAGRRLEPARPALDVGRPRGVRRARRASSPTCSARTSPSSPPTTTSSPPGLAPSPALTHQRPQFG